MGTRTIGRRLSVGRLRYRHLLVLTAGFVYLTALLGVATRATGSGLACQANWPLCDGGLLNMFPASLPSAFEWIHRVVAMVTGFFILGTAAGTWRGRVDRRVKWAVALGIVLLPIQVLLGRETVVSFTPPVLGLHYWVAMAIYATFVFAAAVAWEDSLGWHHVRAGVAAAVVFVPLQVVLSPNVVTRYSAPVQSAQYAVILALFAVLLLATFAGGDEEPLVRRGLLATTALVPIVVLLGRQRIVHDLPALALAHTAATALLGFFVLSLAVGVLFVRRKPT